MKNGKKKTEWIEIRALCIAVFLTQIIKHFIFTEEFVGYSLWKNILISVALYVPIYFLMLFLQGKFKTKLK